MKDTLIFGMKSVLTSDNLEQTTGKGTDLTDFKLLCIMFINSYTSYNVFKLNLVKNFIKFHEMDLQQFPATVTKFPNSFVGPVDKLWRYP